MQEGRENAIQTSLDHLKLLTDDVGIMQHSFYGVPRRRTGYTTDDNARALIVSARYSRLVCDGSLEKLAATYLSFLEHAQKTSGWFRNYMGYDRRWVDMRRREEEALARSFLALAEVGASHLPEGQKRAAASMLASSAHVIGEVSSPHAVPVALLGCAFQHGRCPDQQLLDTIRSFSDRLCALYEAHSSPDWQWFEPYLTYSNACLPHALFAAFRATQNNRFLKIACDSTTFLTEITFVDDVFQPIGNHGWYKRGGERAYFDQQPIEAASSVELYLEAFRATGEGTYYDLARHAYSWYLGENANRLPVADNVTGACYDALVPDGLNLNQGGEACATYLMASLALRSPSSTTE